MTTNAPMMTAAPLTTASGGAKGPDATAHDLLTAHTSVPASGIGAGRPSLDLGGLAESLAGLTSQDVSLGRAARVAVEKQLTFAQRAELGRALDGTPLEGTITGRALGEPASREVGVAVRSRTMSHDARFEARAGTAYHDEGGVKVLHAERIDTRTRTQGSVDSTVRDVQTGASLFRGEATARGQAAGQNVTLRAQTQIVDVEARRQSSASPLGRSVKAEANAVMLEEKVSLRMRGSDGTASEIVGTASVMKVEGETEGLLGHDGCKTGLGVGAKLGAAAVTAGTEAAAELPLHKAARLYPNPALPLIVREGTTIGDMTIEVRSKGSVEAGALSVGARGEASHDACTDRVTLGVGGKAAVMFGGSIDAEVSLGRATSKAAPE